MGKVRSLPPSTKRLAALAVAAAFATSALANPTGPAVAHGSAAFHSAGGTLTVSNAPNTIINWQGFSIAPGELTRFQQQSAASAVLNRVVGGDPSSILGALSSNGRVFLINPNGLVFGAGAVIDTAGFVASTLNIADRDFLAGRMKFEGVGSGSVRNEGTLQASGDIYLIGPKVENSGIIRSDNGSVLLAAGRSVEITSPDAQGVNFILQAPGDSALNLGRIEAANAVGMFAGTLRHSGDIRAVSASVSQAGRVVLAAQTAAILDGKASINVDNAVGKGGSVRVSGERVGLFDRASISARGPSGGGEILVGGGYQGLDSSIRNASRTYVGSGVKFAADATGNGDGGRVIVWSDDVTRYFGAASVSGGPLGGDGGLVETSGKGTLVYGGSVDLSAPAGAGGRLLLDPVDITVQAGLGDLEAQILAQGDPLLGFNEGAGSTLSAAALQAFTSGTVEIQATHDITFAAAVTMQSGVTLKAAALNNVNVNANLTTSGGGALILEADTDLSGVGSVNLNGATLDGPLTVNGKTVATGGATLAGDATFNGLLTVNPGQTLAINAGRTATTNGGLNLKTAAFANSAVVGGGTLLIPIGTSATYSNTDNRETIFSNVTVNNAGTFNLQGTAGNAGIALDGGAVFNNLAGGEIRFLFNGDQIYTNGGQTGTFNNSGTITSAGGNISISPTTFNLNTGSTVNAASGAANISSPTSNYSGTLTLTGAVNLNGGTHTFADGTTINGTGSLSQNTGAVMNNVTLNKAYVLTPGDTLTINPGKTVTANAGMSLQTAAFQNSAVGGGGTLAIGAGTTVSYTSSDDREVGFNNVTVNNSGTFDLQGAANGGVTLNTGAVFNNLATGQLRFVGANNSIYTTGGAGTLNNSGTIASAGSSIVLNVATVTNSGTLDVTAGNATIAAGLASLGGTIDVGAGRTLNVGGTGLDWQGGSLQGAGTYTLASLGMSGGGARVIDGPTFNFGTTTIPGGSLKLQSGALNFGGIATISSGATLDVAGGSVTGASSFNVQGTLKMSGGALTATSVGLVPGGVLSGVGSVNAAIVNGGTVAPGASPGTLIINGSYAQTPVGVLNVELGGTTQGVDYDLLQVNGAATLDGTLNVSSFGGFSGAAGNTFDFMTYASRTGDFATINVPAPGVVTGTPLPTAYRVALTAPLLAPPPPPAVVVPPPAVITPPVVLPGTSATATADLVAIEFVKTVPSTEVILLQDNFVAVADRTDDKDKENGIECR